MSSNIGILEAPNIDPDKDLDTTFLPAATLEGDGTSTPKRVRLRDIYSPDTAAGIQVMVFNHSNMVGEDFNTDNQFIQPNELTISYPIHWNPVPIITPDIPFCTLATSRTDFIFNQSGIYNIHMELNTTYLERVADSAVRLKSVILENFTATPEIREYGYTRSSNIDQIQHKDSVDFQLSTAITSVPVVKYVELAFRVVGVSGLQANGGTLGINRFGNEAITRITFTKLSNI